jgi:hypothetical protein
LVAQHLVYQLGMASLGYIERLNYKVHKQKDLFQIDRR